MIEQAQASVTVENGNILVSGQLNFFSVMNVWNDSLPLLDKLPKLCFDFSNVSVSNSAGLALLLEWIKFAEQHKKNITFHALPEQLISIAKVAGIDTFLSPPPTSRDL